MSSSRLQPFAETWLSLIILMIRLSCESAMQRLNSTAGFSLDAFIVDTRQMVDLMRANSGRPKCLSRRYNITDSFTTQQRSIQLLGLCIQTKTFINQGEECDSSHMHISVIEGAPRFFITVNPTRKLNACINSMISKPDMSGTEVMLLVHQILRGIGIKTCGLRNCAKLHYEYHWNGATLTSSIPLIDLRSIRGKNSDWYSDFGYVNIFHERIAREMNKIHDAPHGNSSVGPALYALWNRSNKTQFHIAYQAELSCFITLKRLRDVSLWIVDFD